MLKSLAAGTVFFDAACGSPALEHAAAIQAHPVAIPRPIESPIRIENRLIGSNAFGLVRPALTNEVEGYASHTSAVAGESISVMVSVDHAQGVRWELFRIGYYQGLGARLVLSGSTPKVSPQVAPSPDPHTGLLECAWDKAFSIVIDPSWITGYYLIKLTNDAGFESYVPFIVREAQPRAPLLAQASVTTWQAYNMWGGLSLYFNRIPDPSPYSEPRAYRVSFDRPYAPGTDIGFVEHGMVRWLEQQGYDVAYVSNIDLDATPELLERRSLFMPIGHDEYWSLTERNAVQGARDAGLSIAFFSGNTAYRRIRLEKSGSGVERRVMTCYKSATRDPHRNAPDTTNDYAAPPHARPENELLGVVWSGWAHMEGFPFIVSQPDHWLYEGTGVLAGDSLGHIVGYEWDAVSGNGLTPEGLEVVAESWALHEYGYASIAHSTVYYPTPTSFVFAAGTIGWANGLSVEGLVEPRLQRVTENVLKRARLFPEAPVVLPPRPVYERGAAGSRVAAGSATSGMSDGPALSAQFHEPSGVAAGPTGELYVSDSGNNRICKVSSDGEVTTILGAGVAGPRLNNPTGIAVDAHGTVFVSDTGNNRIVTIDRDGHAAAYAGSAHHAGHVDAKDPANARFTNPRGLAIDEKGVLYVADFRNNCIRRVDASGVQTVVDAAGGPTAVALGPDGTLYYLSTTAASIMSVSPSGERRVLANPSETYGDKSGPGFQARLRPADGLVFTENALLFCDTGNNRVRAVAFDERHTVSTALGSGHGGSGVGSQTQLSMPRGLAVTADGFAVADSLNHRILHFGASGSLTQAL